VTNYEQPQLFTSDPTQDEIATLKAELRRLEAENHALKAEKRHWQIASEIGGNWRGGYGNMDSHAVKEDGIYIQSMVSGQNVTIFVDKEMAIMCGWMDKEKK
jgi:hypothetical protein